MDTIQFELIEHFLEFSVAITGFSKFNLQGTGQASLYFSTIYDIVGENIFRELLETFHKLKLKAESTNNPSVLQKELRAQIFGSEKLGPIARNILKLWYVATWYQLPPSWQESFGTKENDKTFVVSPQAYPEGLLWPTLGVNPPAAKAPGYGTWSTHPTAKLS